MKSIEILKEYGMMGEKQKKVSAYILNQNPMKYEKEYGAEFIYWTDEMFVDFFICKLKYYKMFSLGNVISRYHAFCRYCADQGYIRSNPLDNSMYFTYMYLINKIVSSGNLSFYTREDVINRCAESEEKFPYYLSVALSVLEGIRDYKTLSALKLSDVDFETGKLRRIAGIVLSKELLNAYTQMHDMPYFKSSEKRKDMFDDSEGYLIRRIIQPGEKHSNSATAANVLASHMNKLGFRQTVLYDSGVIQRVCALMGRDKFTAYMCPESVSKAQKIQNNKEIGQILHTLGIPMSVKNFVYDYRVYALAMKYQII